jgi:hypothetical protein
MPLKGSESMKDVMSNPYPAPEDDSVIAVIKFISGEWVKIRCSDYKFNDDFVCTNSNGKAIFIAPRDCILCVYEEKYRVIN